MNKELLENLLIDRALGQLSPEAEALLLEHLAAHPELNVAAAELVDVVALATAAVRRSEPALPLPPRITAMFPESRARRFLPIAASFLLGAGVTFFGVRNSEPVGRTLPAKAADLPDTERVYTKAAPPPAVERAARSLPFWSRERVYLLAGARQPIDSHDLPK